jgi:REP-associated tyrosine transposase
MVSRIPQRRSIRMRDYDYSSDGLYFVTLCTNGRLCLFGDIVDSNIRLNDPGKIVDDLWSQTFRFFDDAATWVVMPNHLHGIVAIENAGIASGAEKPLGRLVGAFKTVTTKRINEIRATPGATLWQRGFYEHIIRDGRAFENIVAYIEDNPVRWAADSENPHSDELRAREMPRIR